MRYLKPWRFVLAYGDGVAGEGVDAGPYDQSFSTTLRRAEYENSSAKAVIIDYARRNCGS